MQEYPLLIRGILERGVSINGSRTVFTKTREGYQKASFESIGHRASRLANALRSTGIVHDNRVGTLLWNNQTHLEAYFAIPAMGAIIHTINPRLSPEQLVFVINHAQDRVLIVEPAFVPLLSKIHNQIPSVERIIVNGEHPDASFTTQTYEEFISGQSEEFRWPEMDESEAALLCYTSGTTGDPKGVLYSHRSIWLHSIALTGVNSVGIGADDRTLVIVPMFHVASWGVPFAAFLSGSDIILPQTFLSGEDVLQTVRDLQPTLSLGVPTVWNEVLRAARDSAEADLTSLRTVVIGGSAVPSSLIDEFQEKFGVRIVQGWGMTETSPLGAIGQLRSNLDEIEKPERRYAAGRIVAGVEARISTNGEASDEVLGEGVGELEVRGPWITGSYFDGDYSANFNDGWLKTGDIASIDDRGYLTIRDRTKDVIKSGGEWISSVDLENTIMSLPYVFEAAVIAIEDSKWFERPLAVVVPSSGHQINFHELRRDLSKLIPRWWMPDSFAEISNLPRTAVGKFDKKVLRTMYKSDELQVVRVNDD